MLKKRTNIILNSILKNYSHSNNNKILQDHIFPSLFIKDINFKNNLLKNMFLKYYIANCLRNKIFLNELKKIRNICFKKNITIKNIYGSWLLEHIYNDIGTRYLEDIDILIKKEDLINIQKIFYENNYKKIHTDHGGHLIFEKKINDIIIKFECHISLINSNITIFNELFKNSNKKIIALLNSHTIETQFTLLLFHIAKHRFQCPKRFIDISLFLDNKNININFKILIKIINKLNIKRSCYFSMKCFKSMLYYGKIPKKFIIMEKYLPAFFIYLYLLKNWKERKLCVQKIILSLLN